MPAANRYHAITSWAGQEADILSSYHMSRSIGNYAQPKIPQRPPNARGNIHVALQAGHLQ